MVLRRLICMGAAFLLGSCTAEQQPPTAEQATVLDGAALYQENCAECHEGGVFKAPHVVTFNMAPAKFILTAMDGVMAQQAAELNADERIALAEFLTGQKVGAQSTAVPVLMCEDGASPFDFDAPRRAEAWGITQENTRFVSADHAGLVAEDVPKLKLKWAFAYADSTRARSQPVVAGGAIYMGSQDGTVYALDEETGCARWTYQAEAEIRSGLTISDWADNSPTAYFGDFNAKVYAVDATSGAELWTRNVGDHVRSTITGSPKLYDGVLYVPVSSQEWASAADPGYECCTFRGNIVALDANTGELLWRGHVIPGTPAKTDRVNGAGTPIWHPAGAPVWNSPTVDAKRGRLYMGTGEAYTSPAVDTSDSIVAMDMKDGSIIWHYQGTAGDAWNMACTIADKSSCPEENGPDFDFGAPPILVTSESGQDILLAGQKSGFVHALDAETGALIWKKRIGLGGFAGGVHWGMASDGKVLFAPNADTDFYGYWEGERKPGLYSLNIETGETNWFTPALDTCPENLKPACDPGLSAAPTAMPGIVFAGGFDGVLKAYDAATGEVVWEINTVQDYQTVNGDIARGGSIESDGPVIANGKLIVNSGYLYGGRMAGNVLLVYSVDGE